MSRPSGLWRRRAWLWLPPALVFGGALSFWIYLESGIGAGMQQLDRRLERVAREREEAVTKLARLESLAEAAASTRSETATLYAERFSTERSRLTDLIREIKRLAEHAGLDPREIGYPEEDLDAFDLRRRSFVFGVQGSYANLRAFLHLLELSPSYVTVDQIRVDEQSGSRGLGVSLRLSTFFAEEPSQTPDLRREKP